MLNGVKPWELLTKVGDEVVVIGLQARKPSSTSLTNTEFDSLKSSRVDDSLYNLAMRTLQRCHSAEVDVAAVREVLRQTLHGEAELRASDFHDVISLLENREGSSRVDKCVKSPPYQTKLNREGAPEKQASSHHRLCNTVISTLIRFM
jgi:hypothetical protein